MKKDKRKECDWCDKPVKLDKENWFVCKACGWVEKETRKNRCE